MHMHVKYVWHDDFQERGVMSKVACRAVLYEDKQVPSGNMRDSEVGGPLSVDVTVREAGRSENSTGGPYI